MKKEGFTLIELLAVILILGIVALIAIPIVNGIVKESRKSSFEQTSKSVVDSVSNKCNTELIKGNAVAGTYYIVNGKIEGLNVDISGSLPDNGYVVIDSQCNIALASYNSRYCATKELSEDSVAVIDYNNDSNQCSVDSEIALPVNETVEDTCFTYNDNGDNTVTITGYDYNNSSCSKDLVIPTTIDGKKVTTISDFAFVSTDKIVATYIDKVSGQYTEEFIENYTGLKSDIIFYKSFSLSSITGRICYKSNYSQVNVDINYVKKSGDGYILCGFMYEPVIWRTTSYNKYKFDSIDLSKAIYLVEIPDGMILGADLTSIKLNNNINRIGRNAFIYNNISGSLTIPISVKEIGASAFLENYITELNLSNGLEVIGYDAFYKNNIATLIIPKTVRDIGESSFDSNLLTSITLPEGLETIAPDAFASNLLTSINIPSTVKNIGLTAFYENNLQSVTIPDSVENIGAGAFYSNNITSLSLGNNVKTIGQIAFANNNLGVVNLPNSVTTLDKQAFQSSGITSLTIGSGITTINNDVFSKNSIVNLNIPNNVKVINANAFLQNNLVSVNIGSGITTIASTAFSSNPTLTSITINRITNGVSGAKWGATNATVTWTGSA